MRRALTDFLLRTLFIVVTVSLLGWMAAGGGPRTRLVAATPSTDAWFIGARGFVVERIVIPFDTDDLRTLQHPLRQITRAAAPLGYIEPLIAQDDRWIAPLIGSLLSDDEEIARGAAAALEVIFERRRIHGDRGGSAISLDGFNYPEVRAKVYETLAAWYTRNRRAIDRWGDRRFRRLAEANSF